MFHVSLPLPTLKIHILHLYSYVMLQFSFWKELFSSLLLSSSLLCCFMFSWPDIVKQPVIKGPVWTTDHLCVCILLVLESLPWRIFPNTIHLASCSWLGLNIEDIVYILTSWCLPRQINTLRGLSTDRITFLGHPGKPQQSGFQYKIYLSYTISIFICHSW